MKKIGTIGMLVLVFLAIGAFNARASSLADIFGPSVREPNIEILSTGEVISLDALYERGMTIEPYYPESGSWVWKISSSWAEIGSSEEIRQGIASFKLSFVPRKEPRIFALQNNIYLIIELHAGFGYGEELLITSPEGRMRGTTIGGLVKYNAVFINQRQEAVEFLERMRHAFENKQRVTVEAHFIWAHPQLSLIPSEEMESFTYYETRFWWVNE